MKVVLFCGGFGMRLREYSEAVPKPMVHVGHRPILWHVMKYYAHFGHREFILCLGWKGDVIKNYFLNYDECLSNDFVLHGAKDHVQLFSSDIHDWTISFVDTGAATSVGERLRAVASHLQKDDAFLANYTDGLTDLHLPDLIRFHEERQATATFVAVKPPQSLHTVTMDDRGCVTDVRPIARSSLRVNGGYFVFRREVFDFLRPGEDLVNEPFQRMIREQRLFSYAYDGFWSCMDTYKEKQALDEACATGNTPWELWKHGSATRSGPPRHTAPTQPAAQWPVPR